MAQGPDGKTIIIVKKVVGHGGHHGGSWKVAYADFVTSMMAFFMVLWLVNSASVQTRERIASYFRAPGVFEKGSGTPVELGGAGILPEAFAPPAESNSQVQPNDRIYEVGTKDGEKRESFGEGGGDGHLQKGQNEMEKGGLREGKESIILAEMGGGIADGTMPDSMELEKAEFEKVADEVRELIEKEKQKILGMLGAIEVTVDQRGLHLEIMDTPYASMFARGSADIIPAASLELARIGEIIKVLPNPVDIEGHTDATPYKGKIAARYDNWSLSADRANAARLVLRRAGIEDKQVARVVGYAAQRPKNMEDPLEASNRRISISMRYTDQAAKSLAEVGAKETKSIPIGAKRRPSKPGQPTAPVNETAASSESSQQGLRTEVTTTLPEGTPMETLYEPNVPAWIEKDMIFGKESPFFR